MNYKIVASDLDGTLLNDDMTVSVQNMEAIEALNGMGVQFVPSSGRTLAEIPEEIRENPNVRYIIYSNGATVFDKETNDNIHLCISRDLFGQILEILNSYDVHLTVRQGGKSYVDASCGSEADSEYFNMIESHWGCISRYAVFEEKFNDLINKMDNVEMVSAFFHSDEEKMECKKRLEKIGGLVAVEAWPYCLEIFSSETGKGEALRLLSNKLGVGIEKTIAVGDSLNDLSMIKVSGLGLAMKNGCDGLKAEADAVICSNSEHSIRYILKNYF